MDRNMDLKAADRRCAPGNNPGGRECQARGVGSLNPSPIDESISYPYDHWSHHSVGEGGLPARAHRRMIHRRSALSCAAFLVGVLALFSTHRDSLAWSAGWNGSNTLTAFNHDYWIPGIFPWPASSTVAYTMIWDPNYYTRVDAVTHQVKTNSNWPDPIIRSYLIVSISTTLYSGGLSVATFGYLNGGCWIPPWTAWSCDCGQVSISIFGNGSAFADDHLAIGGGGWYMFGGGGTSDWYYW